ncbi:MAG TPA: hypothetical protein VHN99_01090 [Deinococcales bacterium]|nr:hypothetical protein [Deinococcales bacterium]
MGFAAGGFYGTDPAVFQAGDVHTIYACASGYRGQTDILKDYLFGFGDRLEERGYVQSTAGSAYSICQAQANRLEPEVTPTGDLPTLVSLSGMVNELSEAKTWAVVFVARDKDGKELARLFPEAKYTRAGELDRWKVTCPQGGTCYWSGSNIYYFYAQGTPFLQALYSGKAQAVVLARRYGQTREYPVPYTLK